MAKKTSKSKKKKAARPKPKAKAKKTAKPKGKKAAKPKAKKTAKASVRSAAASKKVGTLSISSKFNGAYTSEVDGLSVMNGTLTVPASAGNTSQVLYVLDSDPSTAYIVTPTFSGNMIEFNFTTPNGIFSFAADEWTPNSGSSGGTWEGEADDSNDVRGQQGAWKAKT
ncbi:MAG TPA: hypothetical protein VF753_10775 [Terriglobales bacterium]